MVIDASVLIKFFLPEILSGQGEKLLTQVEQGEIKLKAPDLIYPEAGNILWKKHRRKELSRAEVEEISGSIESLPISIEASKPLISLAIELGMAYGITVYDSLYMVVARISESTLITADRKLAEQISKTDDRKYITWLGHYGE
jgi:predicted nucleic acid-binding protein